MDHLDGLLYQHAAEARNIWLDTLPLDADIPQYRFSFRFRRKMNQLRSRELRSPAAARAMAGLRRIAVAFLVLLAVTAALIGLHPQARAAVFSYIRDVYENSVFYRFFGSGAETLPELCPGWLPQGMALVQEERGESRHVLIYTDGDKGSVVLLDLMRMDEGASILLLSEDEHPIQEEVRLGRLSGTFYPAEAGSQTSVLVCLDPIIGYALSVSSNLDRETIIRIAESLNLGA